MVAELVVTMALAAAGAAWRANRTPRVDRVVRRVGVMRFGLIVAVQVTHVNNVMLFAAKHSVASCCIDHTAAACGRRSNRCV